MSGEGRQVLAHSSYGRCPTPSLAKVILQHTRLRATGGNPNKSSADLFALQFHHTVGDGRKRADLPRVVKPRLLNRSTENGDRTCLESCPCSARERAHSRMHDENWSLSFKWCTSGGWVRFLPCITNKNRPTKRSYTCAFSM